MSNDNPTIFPPKIIDPAGILGANYLGEAALLWLTYEYLKPEPMQFKYNMADSEKIHRYLLKQGFLDLPPFNELVRIGKLWSVFAKVPPEFELHVRAIKINKDEFYISAHIDYPRANWIEHLKGLAMDSAKSYEKGKEILKQFLPPDRGFPGDMDINKPGT